jgi:uncharacterized protein YegP (UPF0339 family)
MGKGHIEIYKDINGEFRWRRTGPNGEVIGYSSKGFDTKERCLANERDAVIVGWKASTKISAIEGLKLGRTMSGEFATFSAKGTPHETRRNKLKGTFAKPKG